MLTISFLQLTQSILISSQVIGGGFEVHHEWEGHSGNSEFGYVVSSAGDLDGDGLDDLLIGMKLGPSGHSEVTAVSGLTGVELFSWVSPDPGDFFGYDLCGPGDLDADGVPDVVIGARRASPGGRARAGAVYAFSGSTGLLIQTWEGVRAGDELGRPVAAAGDVDLDGYADVVVGAMSSDPGGLIDAGEAVVFSGATGLALHRWAGEGAGDQFGRCSGAGDIDGDRVPDIIIGAHHASPAGRLEAGSVYLYSGRTGATLHRWDGERPGDRVGNTVDGLADVDQDGIRELIFGASRMTRGGLPERGAVILCSGRTGEVLETWLGERSFDWFGHSISSSLGVDGGGSPQILVGAPYFDALGGRDQGAIYVLNPGNPSAERRVVGESTSGLVGWAVEGLGDCDGDGVADFAQGAHRASSGVGSRVGRVQLFAFRPYLTADGDTLSVGSDSRVQLDLNFPSFLANHRYQVLASEKGTGPTKMGILVPLESDALTRVTVDAKDSRFDASGLSGVLNQDARGSATIRVHAGKWNSLSGRSCALAAVVVDASGLPIASSTAVWLHFVD